RDLHREVGPAIGQGNVDELELAAGPGNDDTVGVGENDLVAGAGLADEGDGAQGGHARAAGLGRGSQAEPRHRGRRRAEREREGGGRRADVAGEVLDRGGEMIDAVAELAEIDRDIDIATAQAFALRNTVAVEPHNRVRRGDGANDDDGRVDHAAADGVAV